MAFRHLGDGAPATHLVGAVDDEGQTQMSEQQAVEEAIAVCLARFYDKVRRDELLGPVFNSRVHDWDAHMVIIGDFWSNLLLRTGRYRGGLFARHVSLPIEPAHIERWLKLFTETAPEHLPEPYASEAVAKAQLIGESLRRGLFPFDRIEPAGAR